MATVCNDPRGVIVYIRAKSFDQWEVSYEDQLTNHRPRTDISEECKSERDYPFVVLIEAAGVLASTALGLLP